MSPSEAIFVKKSVANLVDFFKKTPIKESAFDWKWFLSSKVAKLLENDTVQAGSMKGIDDALRIKQAIRTRLSQSIDDEQRMSLFRWFVKDYGMVKTNKNLDTQIRKALELTHPARVDTADHVGLDGISTISKCLTLLDEKLPIYDSRVSYAINTINHVRGYNNLYLSGPSGRNASLDLFDIRSLFLLASPEKMDRVIKELETGHRHRANKALKPMMIKPDRAYALWCRILADTSEQLKGRRRSSIDELEILLFAYAPTVCVVELARTIKGRLQPPG